MGRLIFNSNMGIVGARGKIAHSVTFKDAQGHLITYAGAYSRKGVRNECNILCKLPFYVNNPTARQQAQRTRFKNSVAGVKAIFADIEQLETYKAQWKETAGWGTEKAKYPTLRGYVLAKVMKSN